tara:strand:- start:155 stop:403 length:249 start_codon:yes stop_codon:yes gene_type:complete
MEASRFSEQQIIGTSRSRRRECRPPMCAASAVLTAQQFTIARIISTATPRLKKLFAEAMLDNNMLTDLSTDIGSTRHPREKR